ncbi:hypothetical protein LOH54_02470 [Sulfurimonas sp. HSL-3221]|uniref:hypothetical protein n=1 Tax=Sulfurimonadaceae TaxID=2771471 RepID=UPI001E34AA7D|nr:hypothetical protein [Sulfurimonas sp. HSL-3221]UFS62998.1 hypothetical protein LOH54_02470 [Sulfurimonas sp. HSL-3221]
MQPRTFTHKRILLFGAPRALNREEFDRLLRAADITLADRYDADVDAVVEGRLINPLEQEELDRLYDSDKVVPLAIDAFEKTLCTQIEPERIMMSLKLTRDNERLHAFLQNPYISNDFFLKLLQLYDWKGEGFFDTDENRDVTAALIGRYYEHIERNHNVQYSTLGLMHLLRQTRRPRLIRVIGSLAPLRQAVGGNERQMRAILEALALHPDSDEPTLKHFIRQGDDALRALVATHPALSPALQQELAALDVPAVTTALVSNPALDAALAERLFADDALAATGYANIALDEARFEKGLAHHAKALAANHALTEAMQQRLFETGDEAVMTALAANPSLQIAGALMQTKIPAVRAALAANPAMTSEALTALAGSGCDAALAGNPASPAALLEQLYTRGNADVLGALAANPATPIDILQQLQLDARFERAVRTNDAFGQFIQRENIGWL